MSDEYAIQLSNGQTYHSISIEKNTRGYNWTVKVAGYDEEKAMEKLKRLEKEIKEEYHDKS